MHIPMYPMPNQASIPPGSVNEYQLRLGRQIGSPTGMVHSVSACTRCVQVK